ACNPPDTTGKIIVAKMTDPGWVFLLSNSKGIISEKGSLLSHTAIISRELKIPAVVGVKDASDLIKNGDIIELDGNSGSIKICGKE
ncbi:MAG: phosphoenolpyruvate synthase, partial [Oscillospiraceae bacterium]|nr:phosphoenolpyruvate synthase [Oscillospiraceae bacterium]